MVRCSCRSVRVWIIIVFTALYHFLLLPAGALFVVSASLTLSCYSFKLMCFWFTGSISAVGLSGPESLIIAPIEFVIGLLFSLAAATLFLIYTYYKSKKRSPENHKPRDVLPYYDESLITQPSADVRTEDAASLELDDDDDDDVL